LARRHRIRGWPFVGDTIVDLNSIRSAPLIDLGVVFGLGLFIIVGVLQGPIRRLLDCVAMIVAFLFAANVHGDFGSFLADNWRQFDLGYNRVLAFAILFLFGTFLATAATQSQYKRLDIAPAHPIVDDLLGAAVGLVEGALLIVIASVILGSYRLPDARPGDLAQFRAVQDLIVNQSHIAHWLHDYVAPAFVTVLAPMLPSNLSSVYH
jgi:hypothetical protein